MAEYDLTIIVVAWNVKELISECFDAIRRSSDVLRKQIILVDNGSVDGSADYVEAHYPEAMVIRSPVNLGFTRANNLAYEYVASDLVLMLNPDAFVSEDAIRNVVDFINKTPDSGIVGARLIGRDGVLQPSLRYFPTPFKLFLVKMGWDGKLPGIKPLDNLEWAHDEVRECDWVVGCFLLVRRSIVEESGFFLRHEFFMYNDDNDLCLRFRKLGYKTYFYPVDVVHIGGANAKKMHKTTKAGSQVEKYQIESQFIYFRKNYGLLKAYSDFFWSCFYDGLQLAKNLLLFRFRVLVKELIPRIALTIKIFFRTRMGRRAIH